VGIKYSIHRQKKRASGRHQKDEEDCTKSQGETAPRCFASPTDQEGDSSTGPRQFRVMKRKTDLLEEVSRERGGNISERLPICCWMQRGYSHRVDGVRSEDSLGGGKVNVGSRRMRAGDSSRGDRRLWRTREG